MFVSGGTGGFLGPDAKWNRRQNLCCFVLDFRRLGARLSLAEVSQFCQCPRYSFHGPGNRTWRVRRRLRCSGQLVAGTHPVFSCFTALAISILNAEQLNDLGLAERHYSRVLAAHGAGNEQPRARGSLEDVDG